MSEERLLALEARLQACEAELALAKAAAQQPDNNRRIEAYRRLWRCRNLTIRGRVLLSTPVLIIGEGSVTIGDGAHLGFERGPFALSGYILIDARGPAHIEIGAGVSINNNVVIVAEGEGVDIGPDVLIGAGVEIIDSDFHNLQPTRRREPVSDTRKVVIERNVFLGSRCVILKGARIGADSVIGHSSVVTGDIPPGVIAAGSPARVLGPLPV